MGSARARSAASVALAIAAVAGCARERPAEAPPPAPSPVAPAPAPDRPRSEPEVEVGLASYYGKRLVGRKTASGERYDKDALTAAHRDYPFGTWVRVTSLNNGKTVLVRINDRGPRRGKRIIDLSRRAASELGMIYAGVASVRLEVLSWGD